MKTVNRSISSLSLRSFLGAVLLVAGATSPAWAGDGGTLLGGGLGAAAGAVIGQSVGGKNGAIVGGAVGGATGAAVSTKGSGQSGAMVGGAIGGGAGAAVGQSVGGSTGAIVGAGLGGAAGSSLGKGATQQPKAGQAGYYDDGHHKHGKHGKHSRCFDDHPGQGHAYGKYKDC